VSDLLRQALRRGPDCPPLEALLAGGQAEHVSGCAGCQAELALFASFEAPLPANESERQAIPVIVNRLRPKPFLARFFGSRARLGGLALAAAAVILALGLASQWRTGRLEPVPETAVPVYRSPVIRVTPPLEDLSRPPAEIRWDAVKGAAVYDVSVAEVDRNIIFNDSLTNPVLSVPASLSKLIVPGKTLSFRVSARDSAGRELASSGSVTLRVRIPNR